MHEMAEISAFQICAQLNMFLYYCCPVTMEETLDLTTLITSFEALYECLSVVPNIRIVGTHL